MNKQQCICAVFLFFGFYELRFLYKRLGAYQCSGVQVCETYLECEAALVLCEAAQGHPCVSTVALHLHGSVSECLPAPAGACGD